MSGMTRNQTVVVLLAVVVLVWVILAVTGHGGVLLAIVLLGLGISAYFFPTIVGAARDAPLVGAVAIVNLFLGWTFLGWVVALAMAVSGDSHKRPPLPQYPPMMPPGGGGHFPVAPPPPESKEENGRRYL